MSGLTRINLARAIAQHYHFGQHYGANEDYFTYHIEGIVNQLKIHNVADDYLIVAYLHDSIEDTSLTAETVRHLFGDIVADAVLALTFKAFDENETPEQYIKRFSTNKIARFVKMHDITFNASNCLKNKNKKKYNEYMQKFSWLEAA